MFVKTAQCSIAKRSIKRTHQILEVHNKWTSTHLCSRWSRMPPKEPRFDRNVSVFLKTFVGKCAKFKYKIIKLFIYGKYFYLHLAWATMLIVSRTMKRQYKCIQKPLNTLKTVLYYTTTERYVILSKYIYNMYILSKYTHMYIVL